MANKQLGSVIIFKPGTTKAQAAKALAALAHIVDFPETSFRFVKNKPESVPFKHEHAVHEFNPEHGKPVWYVP